MQDYKTSRIIPNKKSKKRLKKKKIKKPRKRIPELKKVK